MKWKFNTRSPLRFRNLVRTIRSVQIWWNKNVNKLTNEAKLVMVKVKGWTSKKMANKAAKTQILEKMQKVIQID